MEHSLTDRCLVDFAGTWRITRKITQANMPDGHFCGTATWSPNGADLDYIETGKLRIGTHREMQTERRYIWRSGLDVFFEDGRFFHTVPVRGGTAYHWCDPDEYHVTYRFEKWPAFEVVWRVQGPRKDYLMVSSYTKA